MKLIDLRFILAIASAVVLLTLENDSAVLYTTRTVLFQSVKPLIEVAQVPYRLANNISHTFSEREQLRNRLREITEENMALRQRIIDLENEEQRSRWLAELLEAKERFQYPVSSANILSIQLQPRSRKIVLDRGQVDLVFIGQPVFDHRGLIGQVSEVTLSDSAVTLITDANHSVPIRNQRNGQIAIAQGLGLADQLEIAGIRSNQDIEVGDILVTSGLGNRFPAGYPVAEVISVVRDLNAPFAEVRAKPLTAIDPSFEVLMVWNDNPQIMNNTTSLTLNDDFGSN